MKKLYIYCGIYVYDYPVPPTKRTPIEVSASPKDIYLPQQFIGTQVSYLRMQEDALILDDTVLALNTLYKRKYKSEIYFLCKEVAEKISYDVSFVANITIGGQESDDIQVKDLDNTEAFIHIDKTAQSAMCIPTGTHPIYVNGKMLVQTCGLYSGDIIHINGYELVFALQTISIDETNDIVVNLSTLGKLTSPFPPNYPNYQRSPRIMYAEPHDKVSIATPPPKPQKPGEQIAKTIIPPLTMLGGTILLVFIMPGNSMMHVIGMISTSVTTIFSVSSMLKNRKKYAADSRARTEQYHDYLKGKAKEIFKLVQQQEKALLYHFPDFRTMYEAALAGEKRIFEKTTFHHDFLQYRIGTAQIPVSFELTFAEPEFAQEQDALLQAGRALKQKFSYLPAMPLTTSLHHTILGYIGMRDCVIEQLHFMIAQISFFHSYHDVECIAIFPEAEKARWEWAKWLPHFTLHELNVLGFVYHECSRDQVLNSLYQILKQRRQAVDEAEGKALYFSKQYVIFITDNAFVLEHPLMALLTGDIRTLGVSVVYVAEVLENLSEHVKTVLAIRGEKDGQMILENGELVNKKFVPADFIADVDKEVLSRTLAPLHHVQNITHQIPEKVTFLEMYQVKTIDELGVAALWQQNAPHKSLAVPLGLRGEDDIVYLNLHEKAHGPHGLIAGTTGSGKSEIIQSYILSLAVNFHPHDVAFLLIDYKGGGMANLFKDLPHHLGSITNLDGAQSMRALISIKAELQRRQRLFREHDVNHINQYQKLYKEQKVKQPMPHLFLISDEFAELKAEQPEFMKELVSTARIGRSLGLHLILATQKPSGVVDDQIWSNSKFKLALKVQNAGDSNEILKTADAANITLPGRAYLQVGNNEIYELFQSAWSGADYIDGKDDEVHLDNTIYKINELGQYEVISEDLSGLDKQERRVKASSELEAIVAHLHDYAQRQNIAKLNQPWLPPLPVHFMVEKMAKSATKQPLIINIGQLDQPAMQAQNPFTIDLTKHGHVALFSSPGFGKSTTLQIILMQLARLQNPDVLHMYLLDFGTNGLLPLKKLPHVADFITIDEDEKIAKLTRRLQAEMKARKTLLRDAGVANVSLYEQRGHAPLPEIVIAIDNYDALKDAGFDEAFETMLVQLSREGASLGLHLIVSAGRSMSMKYQLLANFKLQLALFMIDKSDVMGIVGRSDVGIEAIPGRGIIKLAEPTLFQIGLPAEGSESVDSLLQLQQEIQAIADAWHGALPAPIPMVPEVLTYEQFALIESVQQALKRATGVPLAVDFEDVESITWDMQKNNVLFALNDIEEANEYSAYLAQQLVAQDFQVSLLDLHAVLAIPEIETLYERDAVNACIEALHRDIVQRVSDFAQQRKANRLRTQTAFIAQYPKKALIVYDAVGIGKELTSENNERLAELLKYNYQYGFVVIVINDIHSLKSGYDSLTKNIKEMDYVILNTRISDQSIFSVSNSQYKEKHLIPYEAYLIYKNVAQKIKLFKG